jgi:hypothetical protein
MKTVTKIEIACEVTDSVRKEKMGAVTFCDVSDG